jgi:hypothetical protein
MYEMHEGFLGRFLFRGGDGPSAGASGALFGLVGVLFVFGIKFRHELPEEFKRAFGVGMLPTILINLFIGYTIPFIDNAAHLGGFLAGALLALFVHYKRPGQRAGVAVAWHVLQVALLALVVLSFAMVWRNFAGPALKLDRSALSLPNLVPGGRANQFISYAKAIGEGEAAFVEAFNKNDDSKINPALEALERAPRLEDEADKLRDELKALLARAGEHVKEPLKQRRLRAERQTKLSADFKSWQERFSSWANANSERYGVRRVEREANDEGDEGGEGGESGGDGSEGANNPTPNPTDAK